MNGTAMSVKSSRQGWMFLLVGLAALSLIFVWRGAGRMMSMQTRAAGDAEFAQLKAGAEARIVVEVTEAAQSEANEGKIRGKLLEKQDETHYTRTASTADVVWDNDTKIVMGKSEDIRVGAIVHVTGKVGADHRVMAGQIVILSGYVQVK